MSDKTLKLRKRQIAAMPLNHRAVSARLGKIRTLLGFGKRGQQKVFADKYFGVKNDRYSKWETGGRFPVLYACKIVEGGEIPGLTLDWIYLGGWERLRDPDTVRALKAAEAPETEVVPDSRRRKRAETPPLDADAAAAFAPLPRKPARKRPT